MQNITEYIKKRLDTDPNTPGVQLPPWASVARFVGDHLAVPVLVGIVAAFVYTLGAIFNLSPRYALLTCAAVAGAVAVHSAWIATARGNTERLYNSVVFGLWVVTLLTLGVAAMAISRQNVTAAAGREALFAAGLSVEMIYVGEQLYAMAAPLAVASVAPAWLMRKARAIDSGRDMRSAVIALCTPIAKIAATATSFLHIQAYSLNVGYDQFSAFTGALVADVWFLAASFGAVHWLSERRRWFGRRDWLTFALLCAFTIAPWLLMLNANVAASIQITGKRDLATLVVGSIPVLAAGAFAVIEFAIGWTSVCDRMSDESEAGIIAYRNDDLDERRLKRERERLEIERERHSLGVVLASQPDTQSYVSADDGSDGGVTPGKS